MNGDGILDLANAGSNNVGVLLGNGDGTFGSETRFALNAFPTAMVSGDFNGDGDLDLATVAQLPDTVRVFLGNGDGSLGLLLVFDSEADPFALAAGDFNGDGILDLTTANANNISVLLGNGNGTFGSATLIAVSDPGSVTVGDIDSDGNLDLIIPKENEVLIFPGNGDGTFGSAVLLTAGSALVWAVTSDLDGDGAQDIALGSSDTRSVDVLLGDGGGFGPATRFTAAVFSDTAVPLGAVVGDFDGDGHPDIAALGGEDNVTLLLSPR